MVYVSLSYHSATYFFSFKMSLSFFFITFYKIFHCMIIIAYSSILLLMDIRVVSDLCSYRQCCNQHSDARLLVPYVSSFREVHSSNGSPMWPYQFILLQCMKTCFSTILPIFDIGKLLDFCQSASSLLF